MSDEGDSDRELRIFSGMRDAAPPSIACAGAFQFRNAVCDVVRRIFGVGIHAKNVAPAGLTNPQVHARRNEAPGIAQQANTRMLGGLGEDNFAGSVLRFAVGHQYFVLVFGKLAGENTVEAAADIFFLVAHSANDGYGEAFALRLL